MHLLFKSNILYLTAFFNVVVDDGSSPLFEKKKLLLEVLRREDIDKS